MNMPFAVNWIYSLRCFFVAPICFHDHGSCCYGMQMLPRGMLPITSQSNTDAFYNNFRYANQYNSTQITL